MTECEARHVLAMPFAERKGYLERAAQKRGSAGKAQVEILKKTITKIWRERNAGSQ